MLFRSHFFIIYPFPYIFCAVVLVSFQSRLWWNRSVLNKCLLFTVIVLITVTVVVNLRGIYIFHREIKADRVDADWSSQIYRLAEYLGKNSDKVTVCMDWGFYCNTAFLLRGEAHLKDRWGDFSAEGTRPFRRLRKYFKRENYLYLFHSPQFTLFQKPRELFKKTLKELNYRPEKVESFRDYNGREIYEIFRVEPQ